MSDLVFDVCGQTFIHSSARLQWLDTRHWAHSTGYTGQWSQTDNIIHQHYLLIFVSLQTTVFIYATMNPIYVCVDIYHNLETMILITLLITDQTNMLIVLWLAFYHPQSETQTRCRQQTGTVGWRQ